MSSKISVIIPYFNNEETIQETIDSVINQTHENFEIIVVDDGSQEKSHEFLKKIAQKYNLILLKKENSGPSDTRNLGVEHSSGEYLFFLDADDIIDKTYLEKSLLEYSKNSSLEIVYCKARYFDNINKYWELPELKFPDFLINNCIFISALIKKKTFLELGKFDSKISFGEDWELWIRIIKKYGEESVYKIPEILFYYRKRKNKDSLSDAYNLDNNSDDCRLYIYNKHYELYEKYNYNFFNLISSFESNTRYKRKYYNVWYRKLFYSFKKRKK